MQEYGDFNVGVLYLSTYNASEVSSLHLPYQATQLSLLLTVFLILCVSILIVKLSRIIRQMNCFRVKLAAKVVKLYSTIKHF